VGAEISQGELETSITAVDGNLDGDQGVWIDSRSRGSSGSHDMGYESWSLKQLTSIAG
jgi:hypothetical protein